MIDIDEARAAVLAAIEATRLADVALEKARAKEAELLAEYDEDDGRAEHAAVGRLAREKAERLLAKRTSEEEAARVALADAECILDAENYETLVGEVVAFPSRLHPLLRRLVDLDRVAAEIVDSIADAVLETNDAYDAAERLAAKLGRPSDLTARVKAPTMGLAKTFAQLAIRTDRSAQGRDSVDGWIDAGPVLAWNHPQRDAQDAALAILQSINEAERAT